MEEFLLNDSLVKVKVLIKNNNSIPDSQTTLQGVAFLEGFRADHLMVRQPALTA